MEKLIAEYTNTDSLNSYIQFFFFYIVSFKEFRALDDFKERLKPQNTDMSLLMILIVFICVIYFSSQKPYTISSNFKNNNVFTLIIVIFIISVKYFSYPKDTRYIILFNY